MESDKKKKKEKKEKMKSLYTADRILRDIILEA